MSSYSGIERRRHRRIPVRMIVETEVGRGGERAHMETLNMSAGGFSCLMDKPLDDLTLLRMSLTFPPFGNTTENPRRIDCRAIVVRCEPRVLEGSRRVYEIAASFTWIRAEDQRLLGRYLTWYKTLYLRREAEGLMRRAG
jgi:hypothetical protein